MTSFLHDIPDYYANRCEGCNEPRDLCICDDTQADEPQLQAHNAVPTVVMLTPQGRILGEVMVGSFVHRKLREAGYYELEVQS